MRKSVRSDSRFTLEIQGENELKRYQYITKRGSYQKRNMQFLINFFANLCSLRGGIFCYYFPHKLFHIFFSLFTGYLIFGCTNNCLSVVCGLEDVPMLFYSGFTNSF